MNPKVIRELIDKHFSLQLCRDNFVCPIRIDRNDEGKDKLIIAIGNKSYLVTIGFFIVCNLGNMLMYDCSNCSRKLHLNKLKK